MSAKSPLFAEALFTGSGALLTNKKVRVTHSFELHCAMGEVPNNIQVNWDEHGFSLESITSTDCYDDPTIEPNPPGCEVDAFEGMGTGKYDGRSGATIRWKITDSGDTGARDFLSLVIRDRDGDVALVVSGVLIFGNHKVYCGE